MVLRMILNSGASHANHCSSTPEPLVHFAPKWYAVSDEFFMKKIPLAYGSITKETLFRQHLSQTRSKGLRGRESSAHFLAAQGEEKMERNLSERQETTKLSRRR